jgi:hypothetical protein
VTFTLRNDQILARTVGEGLQTDAAVDAIKKAEFTAEYHKGVARRIKMDDQASEGSIGAVNRDEAHAEAKCKTTYSISITV